MGQFAVRTTTQNFGLLVMGTFATKSFPFPEAKAGCFVDVNTPVLMPAGVQVSGRCSVDGTVIITLFNPVVTLGITVPSMDYVVRVDQQFLTQL